MERCSIIVSHREIQSKTTMSYTILQSERLKYRETDIAKHWHGCRGNRILIYSWREYKIVQLSEKIVWQFLTMLNMQLPSNPVVLTSRHLRKGNENLGSHKNPYVSVYN